MKAIILAAGKGQRLRPLTNDRPKCMVKYKDRPIIDYLFDLFGKCGINKISVITGYQSEKLIQHLDDKTPTFHLNKNFNTTNMVESLFCAESEMDEDIIISYSDIIYNEKVLTSLMASEASISVVIDKNWLKLWETRMDNPLDDVESMILNEDKTIKELGKKPEGLSQIQGQYIGLIKIKKDFLPKLKTFYKKLDRNVLYDKKTFENMYMTSFIQLIINKLNPVNAIMIDGGWLEIDTLDDLKAYESSSIDFLS